MSSRSIVFAIVVVVALLMVQVTNATFFLLEEGKPYCFYEDLNEDTPVLVTYKVPSLNADFRKQLTAHVPDVCTIFYHNF